ncbi:TetR/AcrR family transcriptional regulator [Nesterenkonia alkaliphila]|nr:TetR/AcrR family transcriptional regulator [Nesterenkonia alkaliphila]
MRNAERIIEAAVSQLRHRPDATITSIAREAGLSRVTVYGHFESRRAIVEAAVDRVIAEGDDALDAAANEKDPVRAVECVLELSWHLMDQARSLILAASDELTPERLRELHEAPAARVTALIERGQAADAFRTDVPAWWLVTAIHSVIHGAASDLINNRLHHGPVLTLITGTVLALLRHPQTSTQESVQ